MINVTKYLHDKGIYTDDKIRNFLRSVRVQYLIAKNDWDVVAKSGRYGGTLFSEGLFDVYRAWITREPIPLLNRKEYEVNIFLKEYYQNNLKPQYKFNNYVYDRFIESKKIFVEFNEKTHNNGVGKIRDKNKHLPNLFIINEDSVMRDLANLVTLYPK